MCAQKWEIFCSRRNINSNHTTINNVLVFLTKLYKTGGVNSAFKAAKSAMSNVVTLFVKPLTEGIFNCRPLMPKYTQLRDVSLVLQYLKSISLEHISLTLLWVIITSNSGKDHSQR